MTFSSTESGYFILLEPGDELIRCLIQFAREHELDAAVVTGHGAVTEVELGSGGDQQREHRRSRVTEPLEACSLTGTVTLLDGEPFPHLHGSFARPDYSVLGGQVYLAVCGTRLEIVMRVIGAVPDRGLQHGPGPADVA